MRSIPLILMAIVLTACSGGRPPSAGGQEDGQATPPTPGAGSAAAMTIVNPGFEDGPGLEPWTSFAHADPDSFSFTRDDSNRYGGQASVRIERLRNEPFGAVNQFVELPTHAGKQVRLRAWVSGRGIEDSAHLYAYAYDKTWVLISDVFETPRLTGDFDWREVVLTKQLPAGTHRLEIGIKSLGDGIVWADDFALEIID